VKGSCPAQESRYELFDIWLATMATEFPTSIVTSSRGPEHCEWQSITFLWYEDRQFMGDPEGALTDIQFVAPYDPDIDLPSDATDTGYHHDNRHPGHRPMERLPTSLKMTRPKRGLAQPNWSDAPDHGVIAQDQVICARASAWTARWNPVSNQPAAPGSGLTWGF
jgi:hypothetical protein